MISVFLTGGVATGKSMFMSLFGEGMDGLAVFDSDAVVHRLLGEREWAGRVAGLFGSGVLNVEGGIDRGRLRSVVFGDEGARRRLEGLLHPEVRLRCEEAQSRAVACGGIRMFLAEVPLLYESGFDVARDYEIVLAASPDIQRDRLRRFRGLDDEMVNRILAAQWPILEKVRRAHLVVWNEGSIPCLKRQVSCLKRHPWLLP